MAASQALTQPIIYDVNLILKSAGLIAASTNHTSIDLGGKAGIGLVIIDIDAIEIASNDESYIIVVQGSDDDSTFYNLVELEFGANEILDNDADTLVGREIIPFRNSRRRPNTAGDREQILRYIRLRTIVAGTIATGINYTAFATMVSHGS